MLSADFESFLAVKSSGTASEKFNNAKGRLLEGLAKITPKRDCDIQTNTSPPYCTTITIDMRPGQDNIVVKGPRAKKKKDAEQAAAALTCKNNRVLELFSQL